MADGKIEIDTRINTEGAEKGVSNLSKSLKGLGSGSMLKGIGKLSVAFAGVTTAIKLTSKVIKETTQAYQIQAKAEKQLEASAKNNPYLDQKAVQQLKNFAGELQKISTVGDEQLIPMMSQLASAGRTQAEIQDIMTASLDVSATGMMSLESAVQSLNASYSGNVGLLGRQISELKDLTSEELKSGKAVEIVAEKFKGISKEVAKSTGSSEQLKNAWGDLKEEIGATFEESTLVPMRQYFTELISNLANAKKLARELKEYQAGIVEGTAEGTEDTIGDYQMQVFALNFQVNQLKAQLTSGFKSMGYTDEEIAKELKADAELVRLTNQLTDARRNLGNATEQMQKKQEDALKSSANATQKEKDDKALEFMKQNQDALDKQIEQIKLSARLKGEEVDQQEILNAMMQSYISLVTDSPLVTEKNPFSKQRLAQLQEYANSIPVDKFAELRDALAEISSDGGKSVVESLKDQVSQLDALAEGLDKETKLYKEYADKRKLLDEEIIQAQKESLAEQFSNLNDYMTQFADITNQMTDLIRSSNEKDTEEEMSALSKQYTDGLISYEEYCDKKEQIDKESAQKEYKLKMWEWTASLLTATSNIAQGVSKAIAEGGVAGIVSGALVSLAGAVQIASITANKPQPPKFATGGIVGGSSYSGDHVVANVNSGEMILNASQQKSLWNMANGRSGNGAVVNMPITIENNASNEVSASARMSKDGLRVVIDRMVNTSMQQGRFNESLQYANSNMQGVSVL